MLPNDRNRSIDAFRLIANWVVICVHTQPFMDAAFSPDVRLFGDFLNHFVRIATPFFFLAAGYFFAASLARGADPLRHGMRLIGRLCLFFAFWSLVYLVAPALMYWRSPDATFWSVLHDSVSSSLHLGILLNGTKLHLWFLPALACSLALLAGACHFRKERALCVVAAALFLFGLVAGAYKPTPIGIDAAFNTRDGPFFSSLFVCTGFMIHRRNLRPSLRWAIALIVLGVGLRVVELSWLGKYGVRPFTVDYLLGTYPFGVGVFMVLLATKGLGEIRWMVSASRYSPGAYCAHALVISLFRGVFPVVGSAAYEVALPFLVLALTYGFVALLARVQVLRPVMT